ncbi:MAG: hypothetical protein R2808_02100 [Flavobacterium sp.]
MNIGSVFASITIDSLIIFLFSVFGDNITVNSLEQFDSIIESFNLTKVQPQLLSILIIFKVFEEMFLKGIFFIKVSPNLTKPIFCDFSISILEIQELLTQEFKKNKNNR